MGVVFPCVIITSSYFLFFFWAGLVKGVDQRRQVRLEVKVIPPMVLRTLYKSLWPYSDMENEV